MLLVLSLLAGLVLAIVFQLMLTNLGIALGLTVLDLSPVSSGSVATASDVEHDSGVGSLPMTHLAGFGIAITLATVLFAATLLVTLFVEIAQPLRGAVFGLILWGVYWLLFLWLSTTTVAGMANSLLGIVTASGRRLVGAVRSALMPTSSPGDPDEQLMLASLVAAVKQDARVLDGLPQLLAKEREQLVAEICDRTALIPEQVHTVLADMDQPVSQSSRLAPFNLPSWRQLLMRGLEQVQSKDALDVDTLWHQVQHWVADEDSAESRLMEAVPAVMQVFQSRATPMANVSQEAGGNAADQQVVDQKDVQGEHGRGPGATNAPIEADVPIAAETIAAIQTKLLAYCRYTSLDAMTPAGLTEKVQTQLEAHGLSSDAVGYLLDLDEIQAVLLRRQHMTTEQIEGLTNALRSALDPQDGHESQQWSSVGWAKQVGQSTKTLAAQMSERIADYLMHQDKDEFGVEKLTSSVEQLIKREVQAYLPQLTLLSALPDLSLPNTQAWQAALAQRRDLTAQEIQETLKQTEMAWHQVSEGIEHLWCGVNDKVITEVEKATAAVRSQVVEAIAVAQQSVQAQSVAMQRQADALRKQVAIAAWWLFASLLLSGSAAAYSGWLAASL